MKNMLLVDGNSIMNNAFYGMPLLSTPDGTYTNAVVGTINTLVKYMAELKPEYVAVAFDVHAPTFRHKMCDTYKAGRHPTPPELLSQFPTVKECLEAMNVKIIEAPGYEADDILGTCASWVGNDNDFKAWIITGDRDSYQLIRDNVTVLYKNPKGINPIGRKEFEEKYPGIEPEIFTSYKALLGDSSDNIKGVQGIGEKSALELVATYGTIEQIYNSLDKIAETKKAWAAKLEAGKDDAFFSLLLSTIKCDSPIGVTLEDIKYTSPDTEKCTEVFTRLRMLKTLDNVLAVTGGDAKSEPVSAYPECENITEAFASDLIGKTVSVCGSTVYDGEKEYICSDIYGIFANADTTVITDDAKSIFSDYKPKCGIFDVELADYVVDSTDSDHSVKKLASKYLGVSLPERFDICRLMYDLYPILKEELKKSNQEKIYYEMEIPLSSVLADMEKEGFCVDRGGLKNFSAELDLICAKYTESIYAYAGHKFNINSTQQLGAVLFDELGLPADKKTKGKSGFSTSAEVLEKIKNFHPIVNDILEYRKAAKLRSTYTEGLLAVADSEGRIHSTFNQKITATGRLSSSDPNLQNIPIRTELGRKMREFFIPKNSDYILVDADYSQIELRVLAAVSGDRNMITDFILGEDIHRSTAASVFRVPQNEVTPEQRKKAKAINFGIMYGMSAFSLAEDIGVSRYEASEYIKNYFRGFPDIDSFLSETVRFAKENGYVTTLFGRKRKIPELISPKAPVRAMGERIARNSPIQGTAADIIKIAMINVSRRLEKEGLDAKLILQVHDELIIEANRNCAEKAAEILKEEMENAVEIGVPLTAETGIGSTWYECHK